LEQRSAAEKRASKSRRQDDVTAAGEVAVAISSTLQTLIRWGAGVCFAYYGYRTIEVLAGRSTEANIVLNILGNIAFSSTIAWTFGVAGAAYGWRQRKLRGDAVERLQNRIKELESKVDPERTSSNLTVRGDTNPEDRT
jgi:hypothetical protein